MQGIHARGALALLWLAVAAAGCKDGGGGGGPLPVASAGPDQDAFKGEPVTLDGSASEAVEQNPLEYRWTQTAGTPVTLVDAEGATPTFVAPRDSGKLTFSLVVVENGQRSRPDAVSVAVRNRAPWADAGPDLVVRSGYVVTLNARQSGDPDGDTITYEWWQSGGPVVQVKDRHDGTATFVAPEAGTQLEFSVEVSDTEATPVQDTIAVKVIAPGQNLPPTVSAGPDVTVARRSRVLLHGTGSDPEGGGVTFEWAQLSGPTVELASAEGDASFLAPDVECDLEFEVTATDAVDTAADRVLVKVRNQRPQVHVTLGPDAPGTLDALVAIAQAFDADDDPLTDTWAWYRNGTLVPGQTSPTLPASETTKGDVFRVVVTVSDGVLAAEAEATVTIRDTPPTLTAPELVEVAWGDEASFAITVVDPDGDAAPAVALSSGPAGMTLSPAGQAQWAAILPMFDRTLDVRWSAAATGADTAVTGVIRVTDPARAYPLRRSGLEIPLGQGGLQAIDLEGDGTDELLVAGGTGLYELAYDGSGYRQRWMYPFAPGDGSGVSAATARDLDADGRPEIFFAAGDLLVALDGAERREVARHDADGAYACVDLELVDVDADGAVELVCLGATASYSSSARVAVLDALTLEEKWASAPLAFGWSAAVGDVDGDGALEIVTAAGYVLDGATGANEWAYGAGFGAWVDTGDLDGDGVEEIVGAAEWYWIRGYSAKLKSPLWEKSVFDLAALLVTDVDADGLAEVVTGDGQWGNVTGYDFRPATNDLAEKWAIDSQDHGVSALAFGDVDGDGDPELAWGTGGTSSGEDLMVVAGLVPSMAIEWKNVGPSQLDGPFVGARAARLGAGRDEILFVTPSTNSGYDGTRIVALDPVSGRLTLTPELGTNWDEAAALDVVDYDDDGIDEAMLLTSSYYDGYFTVYDVARSAAEWTSPLDVGTPRAVTHGDLNGDGDDELVALTADGYVYAYDPKHQTLLWKSISVGSGVDVALADLDADGKLEIVVAAASRVVIFHPTAEPVAYLEQASAAASSVVDLLVADVDGGGPDVFTLSASYSGGSVTRWSAGLEALSTFTTTATVQALFLEDLGAGRKNLVAAVGGGAYPYPSAPPWLVALDPVTGAEVWRSPQLWGTVQRNSLSYVGTAAAPAIAFGTGSSMYVTR